VPDTFRAGDLTHEHKGRHLRTRLGEGVLHDLAPVDDEYVQLLLIHEGAPHLPVVPVGDPVELSPL
jgi:hypothetical protein